MNLVIDKIILDDKIRVIIIYLKRNLSNIVREEENLYESYRY